MDQDEEKLPDWIGMTPVKRYENFTRFLKKCDNGAYYYVCFMNTDIDAWESRNV